VSFPAGKNGLGQHNAIADHVSFPAGKNGLGQHNLHFGAILPTFFLVGALLTNCRFTSLTVFS
jgi:hypothetical protein